MNDRIDPPGAESEGGLPEDAGLSVDEKFARLVAEIGGTGAGPQTPAPKEEAARTRELRAKWSKNPPQAVGWRTDGPSLPSLVPEPVAPAAPGRKRRTVSRWVPVVCVAAVLIGGFAYLQATTSKPAPVNADPAGTEQPWMQAAGLSPSPSTSYANPDDAYFAGTPALDWQDNEAGLGIPKATPVNGVGSDDVTTGYRLLEKVMEAGSLDDTILDGGPVSDFTKLLDPDSDEYKHLDGWIAHPSYDDDPTELVSRFNPATTRLLGHTVKVNGSMSESAGPQHGSAYLTANYIFVYAVGPANGDSEENLRVAVHRTVQMEIFNSSEYQTDTDKAWISDYSMGVSNVTCYQYDGYIDPGFEGGGPAPNETGVVDPYDSGNLLTQSAQPGPTSTKGECQAVVGN